MINCAYPTHFESALSDDASPWLKRIRGIRANASTKSHAELDEATELDSGDAKALAASTLRSSTNWITSTLELPKADADFLLERSAVVGD